MAGKDDLERVVQEFTREQRRVLRLCRAWLGDAADAEDAAQEVFLRCSGRLADLPEAEHAPYLATVARRVCAAHLRARGRRAQLVDRMEDLGVAASDAEGEALELLTVQRVWRQLSHRDRLLLLHRFAGYSYLEIAMRLRISVNAVGLAVTHARRRARRLLGGLATLLIPPQRRRSTRRVAVGSWHAMRLPAVVLHRLAWSAAIAGAAGVLALETPAMPAAAPAGAPEPALQSAAAGDVAVIRLAASPWYATDRTVYASGWQERGCGSAKCPVLLRTTDGGRSWQRMAASRLVGGAIVLAPAPGRRTVILAATAAGLQRSDDGGRSFTTVLPIVGPVAVTSSGGRTVAVVASRRLWWYDLDTRAVRVGAAAPTAASHSDGAPLSIRLGGGETLLLQQLLILPDGARLAAAASPDAVGARGIRCSTDGGTTWRAGCSRG